MATAVEGQQRGVSVGRVFARTAGVIRHHPVAVLGTALLLGALPRLGIGYVQAAVGRASWGGPDEAATGIGLFVLSGVAGMVLSALVQGAIVRMATAHAAGERLRWGDLFDAALRSALPLVGLAIVSGVAIGLGLMALLIPGVLLLVTWAVAAPALVAERLGVVAALGRSRRLTTGARGLVLGIELLSLALYYLASGVFLYAGLALGAGAGDGAARWLFFGVGGGPAATALMLAISTLKSALWGALQTSLYVELRDWKDGPASRRLAAIFG